MTWKQKLTLLSAALLMSGATVNGNESKGLSAVVLDWAGTVSDYGCMAPVEAFRQVFAEEGVEITVAEARAPMGANKRDHIRMIADDCSVSKRWQLSHQGTTASESDIDRMYARFIPVQCQVLPKHTKLIPGALETLSFVREHGWKVGSTTGYNDDMLAIVSAAAAEQGYITDMAVSSDGVPVGRPKPLMILKNCAELDAASMRTVKVDDTLPGIKSGRKAGCWTVYVYQSGSNVGLSPEEIAELSDDERETMLENAKAKGLGKAHYCIPSVAELPAYLEKIDELIKAGYHPYDFNADNPAPLPTRRV